jgi:hypothetical protein
MERELVRWVCWSVHILNRDGEGASEVGLLVSTYTEHVTTVMVASKSMNKTCNIDKLNRNCRPLIFSNMSTDTFK